MYISQKNVRISVKHEILVIITVYTIAIQDVEFLFFVLLWE